MNSKQFAARFTGSFLGVLVGELGTFPAFGVYFERAQGARIPSVPEIILYFIVETLVFVMAASVFIGKENLTLRSGARIGLTFGLAIGILFSGVLITFNSFEALYHVGAFLTWLLNFTVGGALAGYLNEKVSK